MNTATKSRTKEVVASPSIVPTQPTSIAAIDQFDLTTLMSQLHSKSNVIRFLLSKGYTRSEVAKFMGIRYQHVRNVQLMPVGKPRE